MQKSLADMKVRDKIVSVIIVLSVVCLHCRDITFNGCIVNVPEATTIWVNIPCSGVQNCMEKMFV